MEKIKVAYMRELLLQVDKGEISFSRMCELINEYYQGKKSINTENCPHTYFTKTEYCKYCNKYDATKNNI